MIFFFRAAFWTLVVSAFIPASFYAPQDGAFARHAEDIADTALADRDGAPVDTSALCQGREAFCETAGEFGRFAGWAVSMVADKAESALDEAMAAREIEASPESRRAEEVFAAAAGEPAAR